MNFLTLLPLLNYFFFLVLVLVFVVFLVGFSQTPQVPPCFAQYLQPVQFLQAVQLSEPLQPRDSQVDAIWELGVGWFAWLQAKKNIKRKGSSFFILICFKLLFMLGSIIHIFVRNSNF